VSVRFVQVGDPASDLNATRRLRELQSLPASVDVIVIGGGITGVGVALDAASRGMDVVLLEAHDLAFGTSRWSSKLVHGGLRYLATGDVAVAWESAVERNLLMRTIAPFLIRPLAQVIPIMDDTDLASTLLTRAGLAAGDVLRISARTRRSTLPGSRFLSAARTHRLLPGVDDSRLRGGLLNWDGSLEDDARLVTAVARTAAAYGAVILTRVPVTRAHEHGVTFTDDLTGTEHILGARHVINATGVWSAQFDSGITITPSRGTHVVFPAELFGHPRAAMTVPVPGMRARFCFALPRPDGLVLAGITDVDEPGPIPDVPDVPAADVEWICHHISSTLQHRVTPNQAVGAFTGLRPLVNSKSAHTSSDVSRRHLIRYSNAGVLTITGGKLTTYRKMAQDAVDMISAQPCRTRDIALIGSGPLTQAHNLPARLIRRYGAEAPRVAAFAADQPELLKPLLPGIPLSGVEVVFAMVAEGALDTADVIERRTRMDLIRANEERIRPRVQDLITKIRASQ
jgi:glycerol-3-phosphate dehydrogenase